MSARLAAALASMLILAACGSDVADGTVTAKHHHDEWLQLMPVGKTLVPIDHAERWSVTLRHCSKGCITGEVDVDHRTWDRLHVGDYYRSQP